VAWEHPNEDLARVLSRDFDNVGLAGSELSDTGTAVADAWRNRDRTVRT